MKSQSNSHNSQSQDESNSLAARSSQVYGQPVCESGDSGSEPHHRGDPIVVSKSQYFARPSLKMTNNGSSSSKMMHANQTAKTMAPPPKHNTQLQSKNKKLCSTNQIKSVTTATDFNKNRISKGQSQEMLSKHSSSMSSKRCGSITNSDTLHMQPPPFHKHKSSILKPSAIEKSSGSSTLNLKIARAPNMRKDKVSSASQDINLLTKKQNSYTPSNKQQYKVRTQTLGSQKSQQTIKEGVGGEKTTCLNSDHFSKTVSSQQQRLVKKSSSGNHDTKVSSTGNFFHDSFVQSSSINAAITNKGGSQTLGAEVSDSSNLNFSKQLKAHRDLAPQGTVLDSVTKDQEEQMQNAFKIIQTEFAQGRAAQRYASVDREDFESHVSLSSCRSEGASKKDSNHKSGRLYKNSQDFSGSQNPMFSTMLTHMQSDAFAKISTSSGVEKLKDYRNPVQTKVNNFLGGVAPVIQVPSDQSSKRAQPEQQQFKKRTVMPQIQVQALHHQEFDKGIINTERYQPSSHQKHQHKTNHFLSPETTRQFDQYGTGGDLTQNNQALLLGQEMHKVQSMGHLHTAVAVKESLERMHGLTIEDLYQNLTPRGPHENQNRSSLSPHSKDASSYRDSESLGFALSERKKAHQVKQFQLKQMQLKQILEMQNNVVNHMQMNQNQQATQPVNEMLQYCQEQIISSAIPSNPQNHLDSDHHPDQLVVRQVPQRALQDQHQRISKDPAEFKMAAARTLQRLQLEQSSQNSSPVQPQQQLQQQYSNNATTDEESQYIHQNSNSNGNYQQNVYYGGQIVGNGGMIAIQEQQDSEDITQSVAGLTSASNIIDAGLQDQQIFENNNSSVSPSKINASRTKPNKKTIDKEVIKYFKRMIRNQQMDKFKAQMNSQSQQDIKEDRQISPRHPNRGGRKSTKRYKLEAGNLNQQDKNTSRKNSAKPVIIESKTVDYVMPTASSNEDNQLLQKGGQKYFKKQQKSALKPEIVASFYATQPNLAEMVGMQSTELRSVNPKTLLQTGTASMDRLKEKDHDLDRHHVKQLQKATKTVATEKEENPVINIVTGGSFGGGKQKNQSPSTQRPFSSTVNIMANRNTKLTVDGTTPQPGTNRMEKKEFQRTLKKAIVSLQQLQQVTKSTTGETPYNTTSVKQLKTLKAAVQGRNSTQNNRQERTLSCSSYNTVSTVNNHMKTLNAHNEVDDEFVYSYRTKKEESCTPTTANLRRLINQDNSKIIVHDKRQDPNSRGYTQMKKIESSSIAQFSSFARDCGSGHFDTFGRPSAMSQEKIRESSSLLDGSPTVKDTERYETQTNNEQASIRKPSKKKKILKQQILPKPETGKRTRKLLKTKKRQSDSIKLLSVGSNTGPGSFAGSKRCSTSHFGAQRSQQSSAQASKESSKRQSIVSSLSKISNGANNNSGGASMAHLQQSEKVLRLQPANTHVMATPMLKKTQIRKVGGSDQLHDAHRKMTALHTKETCSTQNELKKKLGAIFSKQQHSAEAEVFHNNFSSFKAQSLGGSALNINKKRRTSQAELASVKRQLSGKPLMNVVKQQSHFNSTQQNAGTNGQHQQQMTLDLLSPKGYKKAHRSRQSNSNTNNNATGTNANNQSNQNQLGQLYSQLNTLLSKKESSNLTSKDNIKTPKYHQNMVVSANQQSRKDTLLKSSLLTQSSVPSHHPQQSAIVTEKGRKLNAFVMSNMTGSIISVDNNTAAGGLQQSSRAELQTTNAQQPSTTNKVSHSRKKSEALKKSNSSQQLVESNRLQQQWQINSQLQLQNTTGQLNPATVMFKSKKQIAQDFSSCKVDLMQPLSSFFNNASVKDSNATKQRSNKDAKGSNADYNSRSGKSRNISDKCYQKDQVNFEYNTTSPQMQLYKTGGPPVGASRNAKQQFATTLGGIQGHSGTNNHIQPHYSINSSMTRQAAGGSQIQFKHHQLLEHSRQETQYPPSNRETMTKLKSQSQTKLIEHHGSKRISQNNTNTLVKGLKKGKLQLQ